jgi:uncharacterized membrane protein
MQPSPAIQPRKPSPFWNRLWRMLLSMAVGWVAGFLFNGLAQVIAGSLIDSGAADAVPAITFLFSAFTFLLTLILSTVLGLKYNRRLHART